jgi:glycosyltransferase involved in cell wall biosynthesis
MPSNVVHNPGVTEIGIVTPTLNAERYIEETLRSIWTQASDSVEIDHVIVDGGSVDRTIDIASQYPSRVIVSTDDQGMYDAVNRGMAAVRGTIVGYINADDEVAPEAFIRISSAFRRRPRAGWLCGRVEYIDGEGRTLATMMPVRLTLRSFLGIGWSCIPQQTVWARRQFFDRIGSFDIAYKNCGDYDWYARALRVQQPLFVPHTLGRFRLHDSQLSHDTNAMDRESRMVQTRHGGDDVGAFVAGKMLSLRLNGRNPAFFLGKKTGRIKWTA